MDVLDDWLRVLGSAEVVLTPGRVELDRDLLFDSSGNFTFHLLTQGSCSLRLPDGESVRVSPGEMVVLPQGVAHELIVDQATETVALVSGSYRVDFEIAHSLFGSLPPAIHFEGSRIRSRPALISTRGLIFAEFTRPGHGSDTLLRSLFAAFFVHILRELSFERNAEGLHWLGALNNPLISQSLSRMHSTPAAPWTVETLAHAAGMSRATYARQFMNCMGEPPLQYLTRWRMALAANLMRDGVAPLAAVAGRVGYDSEFAFSRAFKRVKGMPPAVFRHGGGCLALAREPEPEMATEMAPDADREHVSLLDAFGVVPPPRRDW